MRIACQLDADGTRIAQILKADHAVREGQLGGIDIAEECHASRAAVPHPAQDAHAAKAGLWLDRQMHGRDYRITRDLRQGHLFIEGRNIPIEGWMTVTGHMRTSSREWSYRLGGPCLLPFARDLQPGTCTQTRLPRHAQLAYAANVNPSIYKIKCHFNDAARQVAFPRGNGSPPSRFRPRRRQYWGLKEPI